MKKPKSFPRSVCPIANTLDLVGDKWSLLVVRDLLHGKRTYGDLVDSPEEIPTNILADRLRRLENAGLIASSPYQERPVRYAYTLTEKGTELGDIKNLRRLTGTVSPDVTQRGCTRGADVRVRAPQTSGSSAA